MSGVGKGIATASIGLILQSKGYKVNPVKVDPYLNVDAGTMNPTEHGEVFVLDSGLETDQDMGNYERFMNLDLTNHDYMTSGMVYKSVIDRERNLGYRGKCVEAIPHITEEITKRLELSAKENNSDISIVEIGGTVGDYQNILFIEAARVLKIKQPDNVIFIMVSYLPIPGTLGEMKTRPTQNAVRMLNSYGVQPDIIIARSKSPLDDKRKEKIAVSCAVRTDHVISAPDIESVYDVPINFERDQIGDTILNSLNLKRRKETNALTEWRKFVQKSKDVANIDSVKLDDGGPNNKTNNKIVNIAIVGKYFDTGDFVLSDAYLSVIESIKYSAYHEGVKPVLTWLNSKDFETKKPGEKSKKNVKELSQYDGIIVPGGFGETGIEGKLTVIRYAREHKIPYFGLCYGMQLMTIEFARNVLKLTGAHTTEIDPKSPHPVIDIMPEQKVHLAEGRYGASMRLGTYTAHISSGTIAYESYGQSEVSERHRHRFEVNPEYIARFESGGLIFSGKSSDGTLCEIAELPRSIHPFMLGTQFHPELKSRPLHPHPLFTAFLKVCKSVNGDKGKKK